MKFIVSAAVVGALYAIIAGSSEASDHRAESVAKPSLRAPTHEAQASSEVKEATLAFYRALNAADPVAADRWLLPGGDSFPRNGGRLLPEAATAEQSLQDLRELFAAGLRFDVKVKDLQVKNYGAAAVATFYLDGTTQPAAERPATGGVFRASYVWVKQSDGWKIAHFHISPLNAG